jgi:transcriptional regulator GlxA family with amidase domain
MQFPKIGRIKLPFVTGILDKIHHQKIRLSHSYEKFLLLGFGDVTSKSETKGKSQKIRNQSSTPTSPTSDPSVAQALQFIQSRFTDPIQVQDVAQHVGLSRRALERRFLICLKSSPAKEIWKARITKAKGLLQNSTCLIAEVAKESGFASLEYFRTFFRSKTGLTPKKYRIQSMIGKIPPINSPDPASR